jgi:leucyl/phenylalanyl-tRNA--protein transferase
VRLTPDLLLAAYAEGIFPMGVEGELHWFSPDPRGILPLESVHFSKTLLQSCRQGRFEVRIDTDFEAVMRACGDRPEGSWITPQIVRAYCRLHDLGFAHSVECWQHGRLVGGLYGVCLGAAFFGESMFHRARDASKVALVALIERMEARDFRLLDIQYLTDHLKQFGAIEIPREEYMRRLKAAITLKRVFGGKDRPAE